jgi:hypothetical protein
MKFSIRDLLWFTVVVALAVGWWVDRSKLLALWTSAEAESRKNAQEVKKLTASLQGVQLAIQDWGLEYSRANGGKVELKLPERSPILLLPSSQAPAPNPPKD